MKGKWQSVAKFEEESGISAHTIRRWCREGELIAKKVGQVWLVWCEEPQLPEEEREYQRQLVKRGRENVLS